MGIFNWALAKRVVASVDPVAPALWGAPGVSDVVSPWSEGQLEQLVWSDVFGTDFRPVTRAEAMSVPAVAQGRAIILEKLAGAPLRELDAADILDEQPSWLTRSETGVTLWHRMAHTLDDWIFYGWSLWAVQREDNVADGKITDALRVPFDRWTVDPKGVIVIDGNPAQVGEVILLPGPFEGLLNVAQHTLRAAKDLEQSWAGKARTPAPAIVLQDTEDIPMTKKEKTELVRTVAQARRDPDGAVMFVPRRITVSFHGDVATDLMIEGRNAARLDIAAFLNLPAAALGAALPKASLNYETTEGQADVLADRMTFWTEPLEGRLSLDDVCVPGHRIRFDFSTDPAEPGGDTGPYTED